jgi:hypothetical protein
MRRSTVVKLVIAIALISCKQQPAATATTSPAINCVFEARQANDSFGSRIGSFTNNTSGWDSFKSDMDSRISSAKSKCTCGDEACTKATEAMDELSAMLSDMDSSVRGGNGVPTDLVQRQERVDQALDAAKDAAK